MYLLGAHVVNEIHTEAEKLAEDANLPPDLQAAYRALQLAAMKVEIALYQVGIDAMTASLRSTPQGEQAAAQPTT